MGRKKPGNELLPGTLDMMILKTLTHGHMHGYAITKFLERVSDDFFQIEEGTLYPALQRLELDGFIVGEWQKTPNNRRARFYRLTAAGQKHLLAKTERYQAVTLRLPKPWGRSRSRPMRTIRRLRYLWNRRQRENQLREEIEEHIALHIDELIEKGMSPEDAKFRARRRFGNAIRVRERSREVWVRRWIDDLVRDLIGGIRLLLRNRSYGLVAVSTLALGIGANTAIFSAVESAVLRPLPYPNADRLVVVWLDGRNDSPVPPETYAAVEASTRTIEGLTAWSGWSFTVTGDGEAEVVRLPNESTAARSGVLGSPPALSNCSEPSRSSGEPYLTMRHDSAVPRC